MQNKHAYLGLGLAFIGGAALGAGIGYKYAFKKFYASYEEVLAQEVKQAKEFYANLHKADYPTPADAAADLIPDEKLEAATVALRKYSGVTVKPEDLEDHGSILQSEVVEVEVVERNVFENGDQLVIHKEERDISKPYVVEYDEYVDHPEGHDEIFLTYYAGDGVLGDDQDEPVEDSKIDELVGRMNLNMFGASDPDAPHILLIRNEQKKLDIEVTHSDGKFAYEVLGFEHADDPSPRVKPRWDDER